MTTRAADFEHRPPDRAEEVVNERLRDQARRDAVVESEWPAHRHDRHPVDRLGLPSGARQQFLVDMGTLSVLANHHDIPALNTSNAPVTGYVSPSDTRNGCDGRTTR